MAGKIKCGVRKGVWRYSDLDAAEDGRGRGAEICLDGELEKSCAEALAQIESRRYDAEFKREGMKKIVKYGIAFYGKNCQVEME